MKKTISVQISDEKLSAIEMYLEQKNTTLAAELDKYVEQLYGKVVPQVVRDYIEKMSAHERPRRRSASVSTKPEP
ncbi:hypothetical protein SAMN02910447_03076 [Ruminococcus sp. YE71]|uniref:DUF6103 family protein n=1 Tax=unclassified Ruminococcus TaxID=2608920 RepID=UPI00088BEB95|nr:MULTISPECIES: DUF6103 family protein [unclassified Ruminococcus]SDA29577.1 hypothetical protein SAMN02910446_03148 [Ruminococcus sp. YE78]SFW48521.1 hypothetical protein SAMN02910447_03076 [Ruminococcus sp. YE71]